jgi:hypothetical protein
MRTRLAILGGVGGRIAFALLGAVALSTAATAYTAVAGTAERRLTSGEAHVLFGGADGQCCYIIDACKVPAQTCATWNGNANACNTATATYNITVNARECRNPPGPPPKSKCTQYTKDINGNPLECVEYTECDWDGFFNCNKGAKVDSVQGASCSSNCPQ